MQRVQVGLIGAGTVGGGVWNALARNGPLMASRLGIRLDVAAVAVRDPARSRAARIPSKLLRTDWRQVVLHPDVQVVVELMGGTTTARDAVVAALRAGKPVVTANKALVSAHGEELFTEAARHGVNLYYEASVAGGIPIIKMLRESLVGNRVTRIAGIVNGTCNYILTRMQREGAAFADVLADAQRLGYAEAEPCLDVDGHDAAHKTAILASLAHGFWVNPASVHTEGIRDLSPLDIEFAGRLGYTIKLLGIVKCLTQDRRPRSRRSGPPPACAIQASVYPALVPRTHVLASVGDAFNAVAVRGDIVGDALFYGRGAGAEATASSVLSDLADAVLDLKHGSHRRVPPFVAHEIHGRVVPLAEVVSRYYVRLAVVDRPGVFARISGVLARARVGISSIIQPEGHAGDTVPVILMIHDAPNATLQRVLRQIAALPVVRTAPVMIRVEDLE